MLLVSYSDHYQLWNVANATTAMATKKYDGSGSAGKRYNYTFALAGIPGVGKTSIFTYIQRNVEHVSLTSSYSEGLDCCAFPLTVDGVKYQVRDLL